jgi:tape measure domain-containing protein
MTVTHHINIVINTQNSQNNINRLNQQLNTTSTSANNSTFAMNKLSKAIGALGLAVLAKQAYDVAEAFTRITNQIRQTTNSSAELTAVTNRLIAISQGSNQSLGETANLYTRFRLSIDETKLSNERLFGVVDTISKSLAISGATAAESAGAMRQLSQAIASGVLRGEEFNSVSEQAPAILRAVQSATGKTAGELRALAADGAITSDILVQSLERYAKKVDKDFAASNTTVGDGITNLITGLTVLFGNYDKATGATTGFANALTSLGKALADPALLKGMTNIAESVTKTMDVFKRFGYFIKLEMDLVRAAFTDATVGQAIDSYSAKLRDMAIAQKTASMVKQSNVKRGGFFEAKQPLIAIGAPPKVDKEAAAAAKAAAREAEELRKKQMQDRFDTYNEFWDSVDAEGRAQELASREISSAQATTESMRLELATRTQVAQFYRDADLVGIDNTYKYQIALANAKNLEDRAMVDQRRAEDQARREEQLRQALANADLEESQVLAIKRAYKEQSLVAEETYQQQLTAIKDEGVRSRAAIEEAQNTVALTQALGLGEQLMSVADGHSRRTFEIAKKGAIASAIISTYQGIAKGVALGYPAAIPAVAAASLTGFAKVQKIKSTNYGGGAGGTGGSASAGSISGGSLSTTANSEPAFVQKQVIDIRGINADSLLTGSQLVDILSRDDKAIVMLNGAQANAQRRGVI